MGEAFLKVLLDNFGGRYSEMLGIDLEGGRVEEIFKWFLASILFGAPIKESSAIKTYKCFEKHDVLTPKKILTVGWDGLVKILDEGGYTRYDFKTSDKLLEVANNLTIKYEGNLNLLHKKALDQADLEKLIKGLGKGVGEVTVNIFLRELRGLWEKADPKPTNLVTLAARKLRIIEAGEEGRALETLKKFWARNQISGRSFINLETALLRIGKDFCRRRRCKECLVKEHCIDREAR